MPSLEQSQQPILATPTPTSATTSASTAPADFGSNSALQEGLDRPSAGDAEESQAVPAEVLGQLSTALAEGAPELAGDAPALVRSPYATTRALAFGPWFPRPVSLLAALDLAAQAVASEETYQSALLGPEAPPLHVSGDLRVARGSLSDPAALTEGERTQLAAGIASGQGEADAFLTAMFGSAAEPLRSELQGQADAVALTEEERAQILADFKVAWRTPGRDATDSFLADLAAKGQTRPEVAALAADLQGWVNERRAAADRERRASKVCETEDPFPESEIPPEDTVASTESGPAPASAEDDSLLTRLNVGLWSLWQGLSSLWSDEAPSVSEEELGESELPPEERSTVTAENIAFFSQKEWYGADAQPLSPEERTQADRTCSPKPSDIGCPQNGVRRGPRVAMSLWRPSSRRVARRGPQGGRHPPDSRGRVGSPR